MKPPAAAVELAAATLETFDGDPPQVTARIAAGADLTGKDLDTIRRFFAGDCSDRFTFAAAGGEPMRRIVTAATAPTSATVSAVWAELAVLDQRTLGRAEAAVSLAWRASLERIGRAITKSGGGTIESSPAMAAIGAAPIPSTGVSPQQLARGPINDAEHEIRAAIHDGLSDGMAAISDRFVVVFGGQWWAALDDAATIGARTAAESLMAWTLGAVAGTRTVVDPDSGIGQPPAPPEPIRDGLAAAVQALTPAGTINDPTDLLGVLVASQLGRFVLEAAIGAHTRTTATASSVAVRPAGGNISPDLSAELSGLAELFDQPPGPVVEITKFRWALNVNGRAETHFRPHERLAGLTIASIDELDAIPEASNSDDWPEGRVHRPGGHPRCHCGWVPVV